MPEALLFDLDGTLADTACDLASALNYVRRLRRLPEIDLATIRPYAAFGSTYLIELGFGSNHPDADELKRLLLDYYADNIAVNTRLFPGINTVLTQLKHKEIKIAVVTNKPERFTKPLLKELKVDKIIDCVVSGDTTDHSKPHPLPVLTACELLNTTPQQALFVGDSHIDVKAANAAEVPIIIAKYGYLQDDKNISDWNIKGQIEGAGEILNWV